MATSLHSLAIAGLGNSTNPNLVAHQYAAITSRTVAGKTWQVTGYADATATNRLVVLAWRELPFGEWKQVKTSLVINVTDNHNNVSVEIDADGYVHLSYGMHNIPLKYVRSNAPLATWTGATTGYLSFTGFNETSNTYPTFFRSPVGKLYCMIREGSGGVGSFYFYQYNEATTTWSAAPGTGTNGLLLQNTGSPDVSAYPYFLPQFTSDWDGTGTGFMWLAWTPRQLGLMGESIYVMKWDGASWYKANGTAQTSPATTSNSSTILTTIASEGLLNTCGCTLDADDRLHIGVVRNDGGGISQLYDLYDNGTTWTLQQITAYGSGTWANFGRPQLACDIATNRIYLWFTHTLETDGIIEYQSGSGAFSSWTKNTFYAYTGGYNYEPQVDWEQWRTSGEVCMRVFRKDITSGYNNPVILQRSPAALESNTAFVQGNWSRKVPIVIDHTKVGTGGVTGYSVLLTRANLADEVCDPSSANRAQADGGDLRFFADSALTTQVACDVISFGLDSTTGAGDAVVEIRVGPITLSDSADVTLWVAYKSTTTQRQPFVTTTYGARSAYDSNWTSRHPLSTNHGNMADMTDQYSVQGTIAAQTTGKVGKGLDLNGAEGIIMPTGSLGIANAFSVAAWVSVDASLTEIGYILSGDGGLAPDRGLQFRVENTTGRLTFIRFNAASAVVTNLTATTDLRGAGFKRVIAEFNVADGSDVYVDGAIEAADAVATVNNDASTNSYWRIGHRAKYSAPLLEGYTKAVLDQFEIHTVKRGQAWWTTDFNNQGAPATFAVAGVSSDITPPAVLDVEGGGGWGASAWGDKPLGWVPSAGASGISATVTQADSADSQAVTAENWTTSQINQSSAADTTSIATAVTTGAVIAAFDSADTTAITGNIVGVTSASVAVTDAADAQAIATLVTTGAVIVGTDGADSALAAAACWTTAILGASDAWDVTGITGSVAPGTAIYPLASQVQLGITYGPTGADYVGTLTSGSGPSAADIAAAVRSDLATELLRIAELAQLHALVPGTDLVVTPSSRSAGSVVQSIGTAGATVTVSRAP